MAHPIEDEIHDTLLELVPDVLNLEEQSIIVAEAASLLRLKDRYRKASKADTPSVREAKIVDAILEAMGRMADWEMEEERMEREFGAPEWARPRSSSNLSDMDNCYSSTRTNRFASDFFGDYNVDVLGEDDMSSIIGQDIEGHGNGDAMITDALPEHPPTLYRKPGTGKSRVDIVH